MGINEIITEYKPHKGFFDLSNKPASLTKQEYSKILNIQNYLAGENEKFKDKKVRKDNLRTWESLKQLSAELQSIIFQHWNLNELN